MYFNVNCWQCILLIWWLLAAGLIIFVELQCLPTFLTFTITVCTKRHYGPLNWIFFYVFNFQIFSNKSSHRAPVVWKLSQAQNAGPRYIRGSVRDILELPFKCQTLSSASHVFFYNVRAFRTTLQQPETYIYNVIWRTVWSGEHFKATVVYLACSHDGFACSHARVSPSAEIRSACCNPK